MDLNFEYKGESESINLYNLIGDREDVSTEELATRLAMMIVGEAAVRYDYEPVDLYEIELTEYVTDEGHAIAIDYVSWILELASVVRLARWASVREASVYASAEEKLGGVYAQLGGEWRTLKEGDLEKLADNVVGQFETGNEEAYVREQEDIDVPEHLECYFDYEAYTKDWIDAAITVDWNYVTYVLEK